MRVLYWTQLFWPYIGGVEVSSAQLIAALRERGHDLCVVTSHGSLDLPDEAEYRGVPVFRFPFQMALAGGDAHQWAAALRGLTRLKRAFRPDLIHVNFSDPSLFFHLRTAAAHPAPMLLALRVGLPQRAAAAPDTLLGRSLRAAAWVTANSAAILAHARALVPEIAARSSVIYNGLDEPAVPPLPLPFDHPRLLCLGRMVDEKGFDVAVSAFAELARRFPTMRLLIAGDGPARPVLEQQAAALAIAERVDFLGWIRPENVPALINTATVVAMPSRGREAFGLVALQAAQMARPVVATRVGGLPEVVLHEESGLLVEKDDSRGLAEAIAFVLDHPAMAAQMGRVGRERARAVFGSRRYVDAYDALYQSLTRGDAAC